MFVVTRRVVKSIASSSHARDMINANASEKFEFKTNASLEKSKKSNDFKISTKSSDEKDDFNKKHATSA